MPVRPRPLAPCVKENSMTPKEVIDKAYRNIPNEVGFAWNWDTAPTWRGAKYYWHKLIRAITR